MKYLKYWRTVRGLKQRDVAKAAGMSQGNYCEIEKWGKKPQDPEKYPLLASAIGRPVEELVGKLNGVDQKEMIAK